MVTRRRSREPVGEPLFGEDWWQQDQRLFQDSLARRPASKPPSRRSCTRGAQPGTLQNGYVQDALFTDDDLLPVRGGEDDPLRPDGPEALGTVAAGPVRGDRGPGQLLLQPGEAGGGTGRPPGPATGRRRPARRGVPGQGRPPRPGPAPGGRDRPGGPDPARPRTQHERGPGRLAEPSGAGQPPVFRPASQHDLAPSGAVTRVRANLAALKTLRRIQHETRPATPAEQRVLARWSGWGAVPEVFDNTRSEFAWARGELTTLLTPQELAVAARSTLNAHYTDAALVQAMWSAAQRLGFDGGPVLEPGSGSGNFIGFSPTEAQMTGVELEPVTAAIATALYPQARIIPGSFATTRLPDSSFNLVIGNVPFGNITLHDPRHNRSGHSIHNRLVPAAEYLSGNVRDKLQAAEHAAASNPRFETNATALRKVIPRDLTPAEIDARLGAAWIDAAYVQQFLRETLDDPRLRVEHPGGQIWAVRGDPHTVLARSTWGTGRYPAPQLAQALLEQRGIEVRDTVTDANGRDRSVLNADATLAAQEKAAELAERFSDWAWEDPARAAALARTYNDRFNSLVLRSYDAAALSLPGLALTFPPRPHQVAAVARMISEPAVLLAHEVGAGKTAEMIMG